MATTCSACNAFLPTALCPFCGWEDSLSFDVSDEEMTHDEMITVLQRRLASELAHGRALAERR